MAEKPRSNSASEREMEKISSQFDSFEKNIKDLTLDRMNEAPLKETAPHEMSQKQMANSKDIYLKPKRTVSCSGKEQFNEKFRDDYNYQKEYVYFTAYHNELIGAPAEFWVRPYGGLPAEEWEVPTGKPVWAPRYVAERIKGCKYHRLSMDETKTTGLNSAGTMYGQLVVDNTVQRLDATPASKSKSIFMGSDSGF